MSDYQYTPTKPKVGGARLSIWIALIGITVLLVWAYFAKIDQVTRAKATVIASARTQEVQASDGGVLTQILVSEGDDVKKGQLLVVLEEERAQAAFDSSASKSAALEAQLARLNAEIFDRPLRFPDNVRKYPEYVENQTQLYNRRRQAINEEVSSLEDMLVLAQKSWI
nr:biotin/lipoyl-binding protein [Psychrobacter sp. PraFG1]UNK06082.1 HlyD family secretion protein [Psychrobacter sp. PraFG1]